MGMLHTRTFAGAQGEKSPCATRSVLFRSYRHIGVVRLSEEGTIENCGEFLSNIPIFDHMLVGKEQNLVPFVYPLCSLW